MAPSEDLISFACEHCGAQIEVEQVHAGVSAPCPECGETITAPAAARPAAEGSGSGRSGSPLIMVILGALLLAGGAGLAYTVYQGLQARENPGAALAAPNPGPTAGEAPLASPTVVPEDPVEAVAELPAPDGGSGLIPESTATPGGDPSVGLDSGPLVGNVTGVEEGEDPGAALPDTPEEELPPLENPQFPTSGEGSILEKPRAFAENYFAQESWEDLIPLSRDGERIRDQMAAYYERIAFRQDEVTNMTFMNIERVPEDKARRIFVFNVTTRLQPTEFVVSIEEKAGGGYQMDWHPSVQFRDRILNRFASEPEFSSDSYGDTFFVAMARVEYFGDDVSDLENKVALRLQIPARGSEPVYAFAPTTTEFGKQLDDSLRWGVRYLAVVRLRWVPDVDPNAPPYIRMTDVVQYAWRKAPGDERREPEE